MRTRATIKLDVPAVGCMPALGCSDGYGGVWFPAGPIQAKRDCFGARYYPPSDVKITFHTDRAKG